MKLILTRHGETEGNVKRVLADINDPLTSKGRAQAEKLSKRLKDEKIDLIFSSPINRAKETAQIVAKNHPDAKFVIVENLKEMNLGSYLNKGFDEVNWNVMPNDVENRTELFKRVGDIVKIALKKYSDKTILFVAHNAINKAIIRFLRKWHPEDKRSIKQDNTAVTVFELNKKECKEILFNCTKHLN